MWIYMPSNNAKLIFFCAYGFVTLVVYVMCSVYASLFMPIASRAIVLHHRRIQLASHDAYHLIRYHKMTAVTTWAISLLIGLVYSFAHAGILLAIVLIGGLFALQIYSVGGAGGHCYLSLRRSLSSCVCLPLSVAPTKRFFRPTGHFHIERYTLCIHTKHKKAYENIIRSPNTHTTSIDARETTGSIGAQRGATVHTSTGTTTNRSHGYTSDRGHEYQRSIPSRTQWVELGSVFTQLDVGNRQ